MKDNNEIWLGAIKTLGATFVDKNIIDKLGKLRVHYDKVNGVFFIESKKSLSSLIEHYKIELEEILKKLLSRDIKIEVQQFFKEFSESQPYTPKSIISKSKYLSPQYTFENFITGKSYDEVFKAVTKYVKPNYERYSPLFLYGPNGLGKTHLLYAVGNKLDKKGYNVVYLTVFKISELQNKQIVSKSKKTLIQEDLKTYDVILIDDIQNFEGKKGASSIFFDVLDYFIRNKKRVLLASDKKPSSLSFFEERIKSRLLSGLTVKIKELDLGTAINIVKKKKKIYCPDLNFNKSIVQFLAKNLAHDVRSIEGALKRLSFLFIDYYDNKIKELTLEAIKHALKDLISNNSVNAIAQDIINHVCDSYDVPISFITSKTRKAIVVTCRHAIIYLLREVAKLSFNQIGKILNRNPSSIMFAWEKINKIVDKKEDGYEKINFLLQTSKEILLKNK